MTSIRLVDLCCRRLSELLLLVDSLDGLPEHLGRTVFQYIISRFSTGDFDVSTGVIFSLFDEAYGSSFLHALRLGSCFPHLSSWLSVLVLSRSLKYLYLDNCQLGIKYPDIFPHIGQLKQLVLLSLKHNTLCNDNVRSLTAAWRFSRTSNLRCLDVSGNGYLNKVCVNILTKLGSLREVHCHDTGLAVSSLLPLPPNWATTSLHECSVPEPKEHGWFSLLVFPHEHSELANVGFEDYLTIYKQM
ncbi:hypothetical protein CSKR_202969 [Clonorchis sinensis]|uniref:Uncharacterized protein n=1 Tax=Clonorchis sinensis TaxID=79923 RepID=A0A8T1M6H1_CLOSI|nr:hypothetical protein CSKR_202969 [Clonorchis sinensis]